MAILFSQHRNLVNKYGKSGSAKMPDSDALTPWRYAAWSAGELKAVDVSSDDN